MLSPQRRLQVLIKLAAATPGTRYGRWAQVGKKRHYSSEAVKEQVATGASTEKAITPGAPSFGRNKQITPGT